MGKVRIIGGKWRGRQITVVPHASLRPTPDSVRETLFNWLMNEVSGARCLDLFAGTGVLGFEALSRGARHVTFIENTPKIFQAIQNNITQFAVQDHATPLFGDAIKWLSDGQGDSAFDIVFLDPPYASHLLKESIEKLILSGLIAKNTLIYLEAPTAWGQADFPVGWQLIKQKKSGEVFYHLLKVA